MKETFKRAAALLLAVIALFALVSCEELLYYLETDAPINIITDDVTTAAKTEAETTAEQTGAVIDENGQYTSKEDVALYIHTYGKLPSNFITKEEAQKLGWDGGYLDKYAKGKSIGGDYFGNFDNKLPKQKGRSYYECDIDTKGAKARGVKRIVYLNDGLIYYTEDHYETFVKLY